jgi:hypothetical protein
MLRLDHDSRSARRPDWPCATIHHLGERLIIAGHICRDASRVPPIQPGAKVAALAYRIELSLRFLSGFRQGLTPAIESRSP